MSAFEERYGSDRERSIITMSKRDLLRAVDMILKEPLRVKK